MVSQTLGSTLGLGQGFRGIAKVPGKAGRPRLDVTPGFQERLCLVAKSRAANQISQRQAAKQLGVSVRSFKRYYGLTPSGPPLPQEIPSPPR